MAAMGLQGLATSDRVLQSVANSVQLPLEEVRGRLQVAANMPANQVVIAANDADRDRAKRMVQLVGAELNKLNREIGFTLGSRQAAGLFRSLQQRRKEREEILGAITAIRSRQLAPVDVQIPQSGSVYAFNLSLVELELKAVEEKLRTNSDVNRRARLQPNLSNPALERLNPLRMRMLTAELAYRNGQMVFGPESPKLRELKAAFDAAAERYDRAVTDELKRVNEGLTDETARLQSSLFVLRAKRDFWQDRARKAPQEARELVVLEAKLKSSEESLKLLEARYEAARIQSAVDQVQWAELGPVMLTPEPVNRTYLPNGVVGALLGILLGTTLGSKRHARSDRSKPDRVGPDESDR